METTYRLQPYEMGDAFFKILKDSFFDKAISVTVEEIEVVGTHGDVQIGLLL